MAKAVASDVLDAALAEVATATRLVLCSAEPANFAGIAAVALADVVLTAGAGNGDYAIADGDVSGRKLTVGAQSAFAIDTSGTVTHVVLDDGTDLQYVTTCTSQALTAGGTVSVTAWDIELGANALIDNGGGGLPADIFFASEWSTAEGTSTAAIEDTDRTRSWDLAVADGGFEVRVTATDGRDFPTANYLRLYAADDAALSAAGFISTPGVGESVYLRYYYRYMLTGSHSPGDGSEHGNYFDNDPISLPNWGPPAFGISMESSVSPSSTFTIGIWSGDGNFGAFRPPASLNKETTYRFEWRFTRTSSTEYTLGFRIYNLAGTLLYDSDDLVEDIPSARILSEVTFTGGASAFASMTGFQVGINSQQGPGTGPFGEYAAVMLRTEDWCGPYDPAEATWSPS